jgi:hypothetical protein
MSLHVDRMGVFDPESGTGHLLFGTLGMSGEGLLRQ